MLVGDALISYTSKRCLLSTTSAQRSEPRQLHSRTSDLLPLTLRQRMTRSSLSQKISAAEHALGELVRSLQSARYTVAVVGESGSGKSSLINALIGQYVAPVGAIETTMKPTPYDVPHKRIQLVDLPGGGTSTWPAHRYFDDLQLSQYNAVMLVYSARVKTDDIQIFNALRRHRKRTYVVRNYFDVAVEGEAARPKRKRLDIDALRTSISEDAQQQFGDDGLQVFMVSSHANKPRYALDHLLQRIEHDARAYPNDRVVQCIQTHAQALENTSFVTRARYFARLAARTSTLPIPHTHSTVGMLVARTALSASSTETL